MRHSAAIVLAFATLLATGAVHADDETAAPDAAAPDAAAPDAAAPDAAAPDATSPEPPDDDDGSNAVNDDETPDDKTPATDDDLPSQDSSPPVSDAPISPDESPTTAPPPELAADAPVTAEPATKTPPPTTAPDAATNDAKGDAPKNAKKTQKQIDDQAALNALLGPGAAAGGKMHVFRGSSISFSTQATAISLWKGAEPTYNPNVSATMGVNPIVWFGKSLNVTGYVEVSREFTNSDFTTYDGELQLSDLFLSGRATNFYSIPFIDVGLSVGATLILPTSKISWAQTQLAGVEVNATAIRVFSLLSGLVVGYQARGGKGFHRFTTGETESSLEEGRCTNLQFCGVWASTGVRNVEWTVQNRMFLQWSLLDWAGVFVDGRVIHQWLYPQQNQDNRVSFSPEDPTGKYGLQSMRYITGMQAAFFVTPHPATTFSVGASSFAPQQGPDSKYYIPGVNRFTQLNVSLQINAAGVAGLFDD